MEQQPDRECWRAFCGQVHPWRQLSWLHLISTDLAPVVWMFEWDLEGAYHPLPFSRKWRRSFHHRNGWPTYRTLLDATGSSSYLIVVHRRKRAPDIYPEGLKCWRTLPENAPRGSTTKTVTFGGATLYGQGGKRQTQPDGYRRISLFKGNLSVRMSDNRCKKTVIMPLSQPSWWKKSETAVDSNPWRKDKRNENCDRRSRLTKGLFLPSPLRRRS